MINYIWLQSLGENEYHLASLAVQFLERRGPSQKTIHSYESTLMPPLQQHGRSPVDLRNIPFATERVGLIGIEELRSLMGTKISRPRYAIKKSHQVEQKRWLRKR